jgi:hypothetical protein
VCDAEASRCFSTNVRPVGGLMSSFTGRDHLG